MIPGVAATGFRGLTATFTGPQSGFEAWVAVLIHGSSQMLIGAPTLTDLDAKYRLVTGTPLDRQKALHIVAVKMDLKEDDILRQINNQGIGR